MKVIGVTGGVGCGKSTVLDLIQENFNAYVVKADDIGRNVLDKGTCGYCKVIELFGDNILQRNGEIDRKKLAEIVFNNKNKLMVLNSIVHPLVKKIIVEDMGKVRCDGKYDFYILEAALLFEDHYENFCDEVWYIYTDKDIRESRLKESRGYSDEKITSIMKNQLSEEDFRNKCDRIIENNSSKEDVLNQLKKMLVVE